MKFFPVLLFVFLFSNPILNAQNTSLSIEDLFAEVRKEYSGDNALTTTSFVEKRWRLPGNKGFDESIYYVRDILEKAGYVEESQAQEGQLVYRIEKRPMKNPTWEPMNASVEIVGESAPLLQFSSNRNMIAINSYSTPSEGITAEVVYVGNCDEQ